MDFANTKTVVPVWLGLTPYAIALDEQKKAWTIAREENRGFLLGLEHPTVVTLGKRGDPAKDLRLNPHGSSIEVVQVDRGGQGTLHSPGQLVIYPIIPVQVWQIPIRQFVNVLQDTIQEWLMGMGIKATPAKDEPGIYTDVGKIGFVGLRVERGITRHGIAINIRNDLTLFSLIRSCGKEVETFDSVERYNIKLEMDSFFYDWCQRFSERLGLTIERVSV